MRRVLLFGALIGVLLFGACGSKDDPAVSGDGAAATTTTAAAKSEVHEVSFDAKEYSFGIAKQIDAGTTTFTMKNVGKELHLASLAKIAKGKTFADATKDLQATTPPAQPSFEELAGISSTSPGLSGDVTTELEAGTYFFACFVPGPDGAPHFVKGMIQPFEVKASTAAPAALPTAAGKVTAKDFSYATDYKVKAGEQVLELTNDGTQQHEITMLEFLPGKGPGDLEAYFAKPEGPLPATFYGGPVVAKGGTVSWKTPALVAGKSYFFMCLIPDPADGVPHAAKGMILPVSVT
jgi:uncharacterized cupredoxin-like copper-binding protein